MRSLFSALFTAVFVAYVSVPSQAWACGCFTPPDPTVPVVQAGERILFSVKDGQVTAHIQIQYAGDAAEFGWLLPMPSVPTLELGVDELFTRLTSTTQPSYRMNTRFGPDCLQSRASDSGLFPANAGSGGSSGTGGGAGGGGPLVVQDSIGPYDYAVLRADSKTEMLNWLSTNRYFVPAGTDEGVAPYIRTGAYFLALKLRSGKSLGDLQPVVLRYASDVGMIPIILTSTGAQENMGVQVWMLGNGRAIPRNYHHTVVNDAVIDWTSFGANYNDVIIRAAGEAPGKHTFVTEYAGPSTVMRDVLAPPGRFGTEADLAAQPTAAAFIQYLYSQGFAANGGFGFAAALPTTVRAILEGYLPPPQGVNTATYYANFSSYGPTGNENYQPAMMAAELFQRYVTPMRAANALFTDRPYLTRLYTTISPADMNRDPVFSFNPELPAVSQVHFATMDVACSTNGVEKFAVLSTEQGWKLYYPNGRTGAPAVDTKTLPASLRIEVLPEEGAPQVLTDNHAPVMANFTSPVNQPPVNAERLPDDPPRTSGCGVAAAELLALATAVVLLRMRRRR